MKVEVFGFCSVERRHPTLRQIDEEHIEREPHCSELVDRARQRVCQDEMWLERRGDLLFERRRELESRGSLRGDRAHAKDTTQSQEDWEVLLAFTRLVLGFEFAEQALKAAELARWGDESHANRIGNTLKDGLAERPVLYQPLERATAPILIPLGVEC